MKIYGDSLVHVKYTKVCILIHIFFPFNLDQIQRSNKSTISLFIASIFYKILVVSSCGIWKRVWFFIINIDSFFIFILCVISKINSWIFITNTNKFFSFVILQCTILYNYFINNFISFLKKLYYFSLSHCHLQVKLIIWIFITNTNNYFVTNSSQSFILYTLPFTSEINNMVFHQKHKQLFCN